MILKKHKQMKKVTLMLIFMLCAIGFDISAQTAAQTDIAGTGTVAKCGTAKSGTEFYVAFGRNHKEDAINAAGNNVILVLRITGLADTNVTLSFTENPALDSIIFVPGGTIRDYSLTQEQAVAAYAGDMTYSPPQANPKNYKKSIRVTSTEPITLVAINSAVHSVEATLVWPIESWGTEYYNIGLMPYYGNGDTNNSNGYLLIAKENDTQVSGVAANPINLNAGETYHYYSNNANTTGTHITSNKPIAFYQTNTQASITSNTSIPYYNYNFEQLPPVNQWGTEFIAPANETSSDDENSYAGFFRVYAKENNTLVTVKFANGTSKTYTINTVNATNRYVDIILNIDNINNLENNTGSKACYITSDKPVGICSINISHKLGQMYSQPAIAWLPPLEQKTRNVLMSPLDINSNLVYNEMHHFLTVIVPTANKDNTTISVNGGPAQPIESFLSQFQWVADNIGGSDYSVGQYYFGASNQANCGSNCYLHTTALVDNPDGLIMLAYGEGSYTKYFYNVGSAYRDLTASFTVNDEVYYEMDGKSYCNTSDFTFVVDSRDPNALNTIVWMLNGVEIPDSGDQKTVTVNNLPDSYYTIEMLVNNTTTYTTHFYVGGSPAVWTPEVNSDDDEKHNWHNPDNWTPAAIPSVCNDVYIPGNSTHYPKLTSPAECRNIYFIHGAELGRPDLLAYKKAHVQYNFGLSQLGQETDNDKNLVLENNSTDDRLLYSAAVSSDPIERERWYMLSSPLQGVVTGDFGLGGFPLTFLMKFGPVEKDGINYPVGNWSTPYTSMTEPVAEDFTDGFAFYMYGYGMTGDNTGCEETGYFGQLNESDYMSNRNGDNYGLGEINGILELPFFADSTMLYAHRTQVYDQSLNTSRFYYINDGVNYFPDFNKFTGTSISIQREENNGNYRFAPEYYDQVNNQWRFENQILRSTSGLSSGDEFLVGNPYMSSIDMLKFFRDNSASVINHSFRIWDGTDFISCEVDVLTETFTPTSSSDMRYIAPLQGFFLQSAGNGEDVLFNVENISTVRPANSSFNLRSAQETREENLLRIKAENQFATSYMVIKYKEGASNGYNCKEDVQKLFSPHNYVPSIYSLADDVPVDINFINNNGDIIIPLGIKTEQTGEIRLTFTGMDNYFKASKIEFIDALENRTIDLTGKSSYTYIFNHNEKGIQNGRFSLRIGTLITALQNVDREDEPKVYGDSKGIYVISSEPVRKLEIYDLTGKKVYENSSDVKYYPLHGNLSKSPLIVKVRTNSRVKTTKIN